MRRAVFAALAILASASASAEAPRTRVAILPVVVYSVEDDAYLQRGLGDMLASRVGRDPRLAVVVVKDPGAATTEADAAREAARGAGADYVLFGSFTRFGEGASLDLQCTSVLEQGIGHREIFVQSGTLEELIPKLDPLAEKVVRYVAGTAEGESASIAEQNGVANSELDDLRTRVEALEEVVFSAPPTTAPGPVEDVDAGPEGDPFAGTEWAETEGSAEDDTPEAGDTEEGASAEGAEEDPGSQTRSTPFTTN